VSTISLEKGWLGNASWLSAAYLYLSKTKKKKIVEILLPTTTADKTYVGYPYPQRGGPDGLASVWNNELDVLYQESEKAPRLMNLSLQTWATGRPASLRVLGRLLERLVGHEEFCFAQCSEVA